MQTIQWYLHLYFFKPVGLGTFPPISSRLDEQDWGGA